MKIEGFGQLNPVDAIKTNRSQTEASEFESALQKAFDEGDKKKLREVCNQFESVMLQIMYKQMKSTVPDGGFMEKSSARGIFEDMLDEKLMELGSRRGMGISDMMYKQLSARMDRTYKVKITEPEPETDETHGAEPVEE